MAEHDADKHDADKHDADEQFTPMDRLKAILALLINCDSSQYAEAQRLARSIAGLPEEEDGKKAAIPHARPGTALAYLQTGGVGRAKLLGRLYSMLFNELERLHDTVSDEEVADANGDLESFGLRLVQEDGTWKVRVRSGPGDDRPEAYRKHRFATTQILAPPLVAAAVHDLAKQIDDADLAGSGRVDEPHITVCYGIQEGYEDEVLTLLQEVRPFEVLLGKLSYFSGDDGGPDVVMLEVHSEALERLHQRIVSRFPVADRHPRYRPHLTVAYVQHGLGERYLGMLNPLQDKRFTVRRIMLVDRDGKQAVARTTDGVLRYRRRGDPVLYARLHAPAGGIYINGVFYPGGKFIPSSQVDESSNITLPGGQKVSYDDFKRASGGGGKRPPAKINFRPLDRLFKIMPVQGVPSRKVASAGLRTLAAVHGDLLGQRLQAIGQMIQRGQQALTESNAKPDQYRILADCAATVNLMDQINRRSEDAKSRKLAVPDDKGRLWLHPGPEAGDLKTIEPLGFVQEDSLWYGPDTLETRDMLLGLGYRVALVQGSRDL